MASRCDFWRWSAKSDFADCSTRPNAVERGGGEMEMLERVQENEMNGRHQREKFLLKNDFYVIEGLFFMPFSLILFDGFKYQISFDYAHFKAYI